MGKFNREKKQEVQENSPKNIQGNLQIKSTEQEPLNKTRWIQVALSEILKMIKAIIGESGILLKIYSITFLMITLPLALCFVTNATSMKIWVGCYAIGIFGIWIFYKIFAFFFWIDKNPTTLFYFLMISSAIALLFKVQVHQYII